MVVVVGDSVVVEWEGATPRPWKAGWYTSGLTTVPIARLNFILDALLHFTVGTSSFDHVLTPF